MYDSSLHYAFSGLKHFANYGLSYQSAVLLTLIGEQYRAMAQQDNALLYLNKAWIVADTGEQEKLKPLIANRLASVYYEEAMLDSTLRWVDISISISKKNNQHVYDIKNLLLKGAVMRDKANYQKALESFNEALLILRKTHDNSELSSILNNISSTYSLVGDWENVVLFAEESYLISSTNKLKALTMVSTELLANAYDKTGNYKKAYEYLRIYELVRNEIFFAERDQLVSELNTKYNVQQKETQIEIQNISISKKDLQIRQNNILTLFFIIALIFLMGFLIFRYRVYKQLKKVNVQLSDKNTLINKQKNKIEDYSNEINEAYTKLQELDEYKQAFTNMLVHDLKNPLNSLVNIDKYEDENQNNIVIQTSRQMLNLILNLLDINKAENNSMKLEKTNMNLFDVIQSSFQQVDYLCIRKDISFINKSRFNVNVTADSDILIRVFINLFTNAIKFSPSNGKIVLNTEITHNNHLKVSVIDNGPGIAKEHYNAVF